MTDNRMLETLLSSATLISAVSGALIPDANAKSIRRNDQTHNEACGHGCMIGVVAGIIITVCLIIIFLCVWSSRKRSPRATT
ncbi:hypothetical protein GGS20DRAFT_549732 [Poronia punctata]|nr:hypothetical protein GGS20DRAFT_549732 [Poronia punctata]